MRRALAVALPLAALAAIFLLADGAAWLGPSRPVAPPAAPEPTPLPPPVMSAEESDAVEPAEAVAEPEPGEGLEMRVHVVHGLTGQPLEIPGLDIRLPFRVGSTRAAKRPGGVFHATLPERDGLYEFRLLPRSATGFVAGFGTRAPRATPTPFTRVFMATLVLWPEAPVRIRAEDADGRPLPGAVLAAAWMGGVRLRWPHDEPVVTDETGEAVVPGIPRIPGERLVLDVEHEEASEAAEISIDRVSAEFLATVRFGTIVEEETMEHGEIGIGGGAGGAFGRRTPPDTSVLRVRVFRHDGSPAAGVKVSLRDSVTWHSARTGKAGLAVLPGIAPGPATVAVRTPGFLFGEGRGLSIPSGTEVETELHEEAGRPLAIRVLDHDGLPLPGANVSFGSYHNIWFVDVRGDVQFVNHVTDADGWVILPRAPEGEVSVAARYGSRAASASAAPGGTVVLTIPPGN